MKLQRSITSVVTTIHEDVVFTVVAMKVTVKNYIRLGYQPGKIRHNGQANTALAMIGHSVNSECYNNTTEVATWLESFSILSVLSV